MYAKEEGRNTSILFPRHPQWTDATNYTKELVINNHDHPQNRFCLSSFKRTTNVKAHTRERPKV